jgi:hypothetical protein
MRLLPWAVSLGAAGAAVAGGLYAFSRPHSGGGQSLSETIRTWVDQDFGSWNGFLRFGLMVLLALGPFVLAAVALHAELESSKPALWIVAVAAIFTGISVFAGGDTDRILTPAGLLLGLAVVVAGSGTEAGLLGLGLLVAAYAVQQEPIRSVSGEPQAWLSFFGLRVTTTSSVIGNGLVPTIVALPLTVGGIIVLLLGRRPNHLASPPATALPGRKAAQ